MPNRILFLLDESGSMGSYEQEAVRGFDGLIEKLRAHIVADLEVTAFSDHPTSIYRGSVVAMASIASNYNPHGGTLLWDTIGRAVQNRLSGPSTRPDAIERKRARYGLSPYTGHSESQSVDDVLLKRLGVNPADAKPKVWQLPAQDVVGDRTLVVVATDGMDTNSYEFTEDSIKDLIDQHEATGKWTFIWIAIGKHAIRPRWIHEGNMLAFDDPRRLAEALEKLAAATVHFLQSGADSTETFFLKEGSGV